MHSFSPHHHNRGFQHTVSEYHEPDTSDAVSQSISTDTSFVITLSTSMNDHHKFTNMLVTAPVPPGLGAVQCAGSPHTQQDNNSECYSDK